MDNVFPIRDRLWLEELFDEHHPALVAYATRRVGPDGADDIAAEVFVVAWRRRRQVPSEPLPWLYAVARNAVLHEQRGHARRSRLRDALTLVREPLQRPTEQVEVEAVLSQLEPTDAEVLRLSIWEQLTPQEIAEVLGISPGAARNRLMRARRRAQQLHELTENPTTSLAPAMTGASLARSQPCNSQT